MKDFLGLASGVVIGIAGIFSEQPALMMVGTGLTTTAYNKATLTSEQKKKHDSIVMSFENFVDRQNLVAIYPKN